MIFSNKKLNYKIYKNNLLFLLMFVTKRNNNSELVQFDKITERITKLISPSELKVINPILVAQKVVASIYPGITTEELDLESANICINLCTTHYLYSSLASRILVSNLHKKTLNTFVEKQNLIQNELNILEINWLNWININKDELNKMVDYSRDYLFDYFGFKTLERAYLLKINNKVIERPQDMFIRVASFINQGNLEMTKITYDLMSTGFYTHASPTLFNAGNKRSQLASCFLLGTEDSIEGITKTWGDVSKISKWGGGIGLHVSNIRGKDSLIRGTNGPSSGIIPMLKVYNEIARYIDQCFIGSVNIYSERGLIPIEDVKPKDKVFTIDGSLQEVERIYNDQYNNTILNFSIMHDYENIKVTPSHPFYVIKGENINTFEIVKNKLDKNLIYPEWIDAKNITQADLIGFPIPKFTIDNLHLDETDCYMYGLIICAGTIDKNTNKIQISLGTNKQHEINYCYTYLIKNDIEFTREQDDLMCKIIWTISSKFKFVYSQLYDINKEKNIDNYLLHLPEDKLLWILKGIIDIKGTFTKKIDYNNENITLRIKNKKLIDNIKFILLKLGILCSGYCTHTESINKTYVLKIPRVKKITELINIESFDTLTYFNHNDILYTQIANITEEQISTIVYDLEIKNNHNYLTQAGLVHNGGKRKGSIAIYLEPHHPDIMAFLDLRKNFGAETERARDLFLAVWVSDLFMKQVELDGDWYLLCPNICLGIENTYGEEFEKLYWSFVNEGKYKTKMKARTIMTAIIDSQLETGTPYITFKDHANNKSNQKNIGVIKSSNLCNEILEYSDHEEYAVCNLASIAINKFVVPFNINMDLVWKIYTKENCKYCTWAKSYLTNNNIKFEEIIIEANELKILLNKSSEYKITYPQIFYDTNYIGGWDELFNYLKGTFDWEKLYAVAYTAATNLNKVIDINYYPVPEAKKSNIRHRPIGLGIQGLSDALVLLRIPFDSEESIIFNEKMMETIYLAALTASNDESKKRCSDMKKLININETTKFSEYWDPNFILLDQELNRIYHEIKPNQCELKLEANDKCGSYSTFEGSPTSYGLFQFDLWNKEPKFKDKWLALKEQVIKYGIRNSLVTALMPTASTSQILGNNECFEAFTNNIYTRRTLAGDFPLVNKYLIDDLMLLNLWNNEMKQMILANNGSIANFDNIPDQIKRLYQIIWEIKQIWVLKNAVARGPYVDQTQSMNIFMAVPDSQKLYSSHFWAWKNGLKTGIYYLRSKPSSEATKFTVDPNTIKKMQLLSSDNSCESCSA